MGQDTCEYNMLLESRRDTLLKQHARARPSTALPCPQHFGQCWVLKWCHPARCLLHPCPCFCLSSCKALLGCFWLAQLLTSGGESGPGTSLSFHPLGFFSSGDLLDPSANSSISRGGRTHPAVGRHQDEPSYRVIKRRKWDDSVKAGAELLRSMLIYPDEGISHRCCNILEPAWCVCVCVRQICSSGYEQGLHVLDSFGEWTYGGRGCTVA